MLYYNFHIGDFIKKTIHLSDEEELAYRRLIDWYYMKETPLPKSTKGVAKIARCKIRVAEAVLNEFFELTEEGWSNSRCDKEIDNYYEKRRKCSIAGKKSGKARKRTDVQRTLNGRSTDAPTDVEPAINHNPESKRSSKHKDSKSKTTPQDTSSLTSRQKSILQEFSNEKYFIRVQGMGDVTIIKSLDDPIMAAKVSSPRMWG